MKKALSFVMVAGFIFSVSAGKYALTNDIDPDIVDVFIRIAGTYEWVDDWLRVDEVIATDSTRVFGMENGYYDIKLFDDLGQWWLNSEVPIFGYVDSEIDEEFDLIDDDLD